MGLLENKVVIVTGGGRGIGREHCLEMAKQGASVAIVDPGVGVKGEAMAEEPADAVVAEIEASGGKAVALKASVTSWAACAGVIAETVECFGRLDAVVNNAGILRDRMITSMTEDDFDAVIAVHLKGTFQMMKHACDHWRAIAKAGGDSRGHIVNTTSGTGLFGQVGQANYAAAKAGIAALTVVTAMEMDRYGVTCNAISPIAATRMTAGLSGVVRAEPASNASPSTFDPLHPRVTSPLVAYLASEASSWLSGQVLRVSGNTIMRVEGWKVTADQYVARSGEFFEADELVDGLRRTYGVIPRGIASPLKSEKLGVTVQGV